MCDVCVCMCVNMCVLEYVIVCVCIVCKHVCVCLMSVMRLVGDEVGVGMLNTKPSGHVSSTDPACLI